MNERIISFRGYSHFEGDALFVFRGSDGADVPLQVDKGVLPALLGGCLSAIAETQIGGEDKFTSQPLRVIGSRSAVTKSREPLLMLTVQGGGHLPIAFPRSAIEGLRRQLALLLELTKPAGEGH
jgi:hypothetical protein